MFTRLSIAFILTLLIAIDAIPQELWTAKDGSIRNIDTRAIHVTGTRMYLATKNELYSSNGSNGKWESIFFIPSGDNEIKCVGGNYGNLFIGTRHGLYRSQDRGKTWRDIFWALMPDKKSILAIDASGSEPARTFIGTKAGLFLSHDNGGRWRDISGILKNRHIKCLALSGDYLYVGSDDGLYLAKNSVGNWQRVFVCSKPEEAAEAESDADEEPDDLASTGINYISISGARVYAATSGKIIYSDDPAAGWNYLPAMGLHGVVNAILTPRRPGRLYAATTKGVYEFIADQGRWNEIYKGLDRSVDVKSIVFAGRDEKALWASTDNGLYKIEIGSVSENQFIDVERNLKTMKVAFDGEPSFKELQAAAMKYNDVLPEKIKEWRAMAQVRALAPKVSVGIDNSKSNTYEIYTSATKDYVVSGPDDKSEGIDISVSWDLADLIWSGDQTVIDTRSRLNTQLRSDILDDLRRVYFERRRLQYELMAAPPVDVKLRFEKELRIAELTQAIDDITGNYLTMHTRK